MALQKYSLRTTHDQKDLRLDQALAVLLPTAIGQPLSKSKIRMLIVAGAVYLNGMRVRIASKSLQANAKVDVFLDLKKLFANDAAATQDRIFEMAAAHILFEDEWLIAVNKPAGLPTQPTVDEARSNLYAAVKKYLAKREGVAEAYVGLHHRLDRDTSGVVIFTKQKDANLGVAEAFAKHSAQKTYLALVERPEKLPPREWIVKNFLAKERAAPGRPSARNRYASVRSGGDVAETAFTLREEFARGLLVEARPKTGRTHQIRVHLSEAGLPIWGDLTYGSRERDSRTLLHAANLTFPHPITKVKTSIQSPLPEDFEQCIQRLRTGGNPKSPDGPGAKVMPRLPVPRSKPAGKSS